MHDGVWDRGILYPPLFFKFILIFMKKLAHVGDEYSRNILKIIFLFLDEHVNYNKFIIILNAPSCTYIYKIILLTIFLKI